MKRFTFGEDFSADHRQGDLDSVPSSPAKAQAIGPSLRKKLPFDSLRDAAGVGAGPGRRSGAGRTVAQRTTAEPH